ncbi:MAG: hypothetical protein M3Z85_10435, partial [Acidobacteriota bacterium]|nr:hypothetical protein [Acidobacteriota bacterium]
NIRAWDSVGLKTTWAGSPLIDQNPSLLRANKLTATRLRTDSSGKKVVLGYTKNGVENMPKFGLAVVRFVSLDQDPKFFDVSAPREASPISAFETQYREIG